ncbi:MAG: hypothetical protein V4858_22310 [Pseudomonadota bacterium]
MEKSDPQLDAALKTYADHFDRAEPPSGLTDTVMDQVRALRRAQSGVLSAELQQFMALVAASSQLQNRLCGSGAPSEFVALMLHLAAERGIRLQKGEVYALLRRHIAANDGELSDDQLDGVAAAAAPLPLQCMPASMGFNSGVVSNAGLLTWVLGNHPYKP